jgi:hypothetical protein
MMIALILDDSHLQFSNEEYSNLQFSIFENRNSQSINLQFSKTQLTILLVKKMQLPNDTEENLISTISELVIRRSLKISSTMFSQFPKKSNEISLLIKGIAMAPFPALIKKALGSRIGMRAYPALLSKLTEH